MTIPRGSYANLARNSSLSSHSLLVKSVEEKFNHLVLLWIMLEARSSIIKLGFGEFFKPQILEVSASMQPC